MADVTVLNSEVTALGTVTELNLAAATETVVDTAQTFIITPDPEKQMGRCAIVIENAVAGLAFSLAPGEFWASGVALTGTVAAFTSTLSVIVVESAKYKKANGTMSLTLTPASGKALSGASSHAAKVGFLELY